MWRFRSLTVLKSANTRKLHSAIKLNLFNISARPAVTRYVFSLLIPFFYPNFWFLIPQKKLLIPGHLLACDPWFRGCEPSVQAGSLCFIFVDHNTLNSQLSSPPFTCIMNHLIILIISRLRSGVCPSKKIRINKTHEELKTPHPRQLKNYMIVPRSLMYG